MLKTNCVFKQNIFRNKFQNAKLTRNGTYFYDSTVNYIN